jgi:hypothetical protein
MAQLIETGKHQAITVPGRLHSSQILRLGELIQSVIDENGGWGLLHMELRGGDIHKVSKETSELFSPDRLLRSTA